MTTTYFHGTSRVLPVGTRLKAGVVPGNWGNGGKQASQVVWLTDDPADAKKWAKEGLASAHLRETGEWRPVADSEVHVYEVEPVGEVTPQKAPNPYVQHFTVAEAVVTAKTATKTAMPVGPQPSGLVYRYIRRYPLPDAIVAMLDGEIIGLLSFRKASESNYGFSEVALAWVDPAHRRRGIGTEMLRKARQRVPDLTHSTDRTEDAEAWSATTGVPREERAQETHGTSIKEQVENSIKHIERMLAGGDWKAVEAAKTAMPSPVSKAWRDSLDDEGRQMMAAWERDPRLLKGPWRRKFKALIATAPSYTGTLYRGINVKDADNYIILDAAHHTPGDRIEVPYFASASTEPVIAAGFGGTVLVMERETGYEIGNSLEEVVIEPGVFEVVRAEDLGRADARAPIDGVSVFQTKQVRLHVRRVAKTAAKTAANGVWFHASPSLLEPGTALRPATKSRFHWARPDRVYFSHDISACLPHVGGYTKVFDGKAHVYQVEPLGEIEDDNEAVQYLPGASYMAPDAVVVKRLTMDEVDAALRLPKTALPSWRDRGRHPEADCVIAPDLGRSRGNYYAVFTYGQQMGRASTLREAKQMVEEVYGPQTWTKVPGDQVPKNDRVWGLTTEFNDAPYYLIVERLPTLGTWAKAGSRTAAMTLPPPFKFVVRPRTFRTSVPGVPWGDNGQRLSVVDTNLAATPDPGEGRYPGMAPHLHGEVAYLDFAVLPDGMGRDAPNKYEHLRDAPCVGVDMMLVEQHGGIGLASAMMDWLHHQYPGYYIFHGSRTPNGQAWWRKYAPRHGWANDSEGTTMGGAFPEQYGRAATRRFAHKYLVEVEWSDRAEPGLTLNTYNEVMEIEADTDSEAIRYAHSIVDTGYSRTRDRRSPLNDGMVTRVTILEVEL